MPARRAVLHIDCVGCGTPLPLPGVTSNVTCEACHWQGAREPARWHWVLSGRPATIAAGEQILGETRAEDLTCASCAAPIVDGAIEAALSRGANSVPCARCGAVQPMRRLEAFFPGHISAVIGENAAPRAGAASVNVPCSNCGAQVVVDGSTSAPTCIYCGTRNTLDPAVWRQVRPLVHPFFLWLTAAAAREAARVSQAGPDVVPSPGLPRGAMIGIGVAVVGVVISSVVGVLVSGVGVAASTPSSAPRGWGVAGAPCNGMQAACTTDKKAELHCSAGKFVVALSCKGPKGCRLVGGGKSVSCDYTLADENDPCCVEDSACSTDRKSELSCDGTKFVKRSTCKGPDGCALTPEAKGGYTLSCDDHIADEGDPCVGAGSFACDSAKKSMLVCKGGRFAFAQACSRKRCSVTSDPVANTHTIRCN